MRSTAAAVLFLLAAPARGATYDLFGESYCVDTLQLNDFTFTGVAVSATLASNGVVGGAALDFVAGATPDADRLIVALNVEPTTSGPHLFVLTGADVRGRFGAESSVSFLYGPNVADAVGGRPAAVLLANEANSGVGADRNLYVTTFTNADTLRAYDLDTFTAAANAYVDDAVAAIEASTFIWGNAAMERSPVPGRVLVGGEAPNVGGPALLTLDASSFTFDANLVQIPGFVPGDRVGDLARLADGSYLATNFADGTQALFTMSLSASGTPPVLTPSVIAVQDFAAAPVPGTPQGAIWNGAAAGRELDGRQVLYLTARGTAAEGQRLLLVTLTGETADGCVSETDFFSGVIDRCEEGEYLDLRANRCAALPGTGCAGTGTLAAAALAPALLMRRRRRLP